MNAIPTMPVRDSVTNARRINQSFTAAYEKRLLIWMAERVPLWLTSDQLTLLGLWSQIGAGAFYVLSRYNKYGLIGVIACIVLNWFGDSMDGTLARVRNQQRPRYGFYVDHMVDVVGAAALMCGLGFSGFTHWMVAMAMLIAFLLLAAESYLATYTLGCFKLSQGWFGPTEIRILLIIGNLALLRSPYAMLFGRRFLLFDVGGVITATLMAVMVVVTAVRHTADLYRQEPLHAFERKSWWSPTHDAMKPRREWGTQHRESAPDAMKGTQALTATRFAGPSMDQRSQRGRRASHLRQGPRVSRRRSQARR